MEEAIIEMEKLWDELLKFFLEKRRGILHLTYIPVDVALIFLVFMFIFFMYKDTKIERRKSFVEVLFYNNVKIFIHNIPKSKDIEKQECTFKMKIH
jgi:hypothetical protein